MRLYGRNTCTHEKVLPFRKTTILIDLESNLEPLDGGETDRESEAENNENAGGESWLCEQSLMDAVLRQVIVWWNQSCYEFQYINQKSDPYYKIKQVLMLQNQTTYEGYLSKWTGYFSKNEKKFGVLLLGHQNFYYTDVANIGMIEPNNISPFIPTVNENPAVLQQNPFFLLPGWRSIDLTTVDIVPSRGTENKFHFKNINNDTKTTFVVDAVCSRNFWVKMLQQAKNKNQPDPRFLSLSAKEELEIKEQQEQIFRYERERNEIFQKISALELAYNKSELNPQMAQIMKELISMKPVSELMTLDNQFESFIVDARDSELYEKSERNSNNFRYSVAVFEGDEFFTPQTIDEIETNVSVEQQILALAQNFTPLNKSDDYRAPDAAREGGFALDDPVILNKFRSAFKELILQVGRMLLAGNFELYKVSFPIKAMSPVSILQLIAGCSLHAPMYLNAAALHADPVERMKFVIANSISYIYPTHCFDKPLNPILGETYQAEMQDGSQLFLEQVVHHPPISYIHITGPKQLYRWYGYTSLAPKASFNSISLYVTGTKTMEFADGSKIVYTPTQDIFQNTLWGTLLHQLTGRCEFRDKKNDLYGYYDLGVGGPNKRNPKDYLVGQIQRNSKVVSNISGNYMGYLDFDGQRYFDLRDVVNYKPLDVKVSLPSDATKRSDSIAFLSGDVEQAQENKNNMELQQRADRKLREEAAKRRQKGGPKIVYSYRK